MTLEELRTYRSRKERQTVDKIYKEGKAQKLGNESYDQQKKIQKKLVTAMGEESENESEVEDAA